MLIKCPYCGMRPSEEFTYLGDAAVVRPTSNDPESMNRWFDYVYLRDNPKGRMHEYWHHGGGCRDHSLYSASCQYFFLVRRGKCSSG